MPFLAARRKRKVRSFFAGNVKILYFILGAADKSAKTAPALLPPVIDGASATRNATVSGAMT
jgi:hypothetical protein